MLLPVKSSGLFSGRSLFCQRFNICEGIDMNAKAFNPFHMAQEQLDHVADAILPMPGCPPMATSMDKTIEINGQDLVIHSPGYITATPLEVHPKHILDLRH
jgi:hypothetical protein